MNTPSWEDAVEVEDAFAAIDAAKKLVGDLVGDLPRDLPENKAMLLRTTEGSLFTLGSRYWLAVGTKLIREYPHCDIVIIVDAGEDAGIAMGAIADGHKAIRFIGDEQTFVKLQQIAQENSSMVIR